MMHSSGTGHTAQHPLSLMLSFGNQRNHHAEDNDDPYGIKYNLLGAQIALFSLGYIAFLFRHSELLVQMQAACMAA
jgi:hypothetical protein